MLGLQACTPTPGSTIYFLNPNFQWENCLITNVSGMRSFAYPYFTEMKAVRKRKIRKRKDQTLNCEGKVFRRGY
jgi:hypothetical protein